MLASQTRLQDIVKPGHNLLLEVNAFKPVHALDHCLSGCRESIRVSSALEEEFYINVIYFFFDTSYNIQSVSFVYKTVIIYSAKYCKK